MSKTTSIRTPPAAAGGPMSFPVLMRLPDLRFETTTVEEALPAVAPVPETEPTLLTAALTQLELPLADDLPPAASSEVATAVEIDSAELPATAVSPVPAVPSPSEVQGAGAVVAATEEAAALPDPLGAPSVASADAPDSKPSPPLADVTNSSPADTAEPVSPAAARRQRALERQRRQTPATAPPSKWWKSHFPAIAVGFLLALMLTIYMARRDRAAQRSSQATANIEIPSLDIDMGESGGSHSPDSAEAAMLTVEPGDAVAEPVAAAVPALSKSPPLLSAKSPTSEERIETEEPRTAARPVATDVEAQPVSNTSDALADDYPSTAPDVHRPGGRVTKQARVRSYPQTSTPHLR